MEIRKQKLDKVKSENSKHFNKMRIESMSTRLIGYYADLEKKKRKEEGLCKCCYYVNVDRIGGSAMTTVECANCSKHIYFSNTCTDLLCIDCAKELKQCKHCGQKMD